MANGTPESQRATTNMQNAANQASESLKALSRLSESLGNAMEQTMNTAREASRAEMKHTSLKQQLINLDHKDYQIRTKAHEAIKRWMTAEAARAKKALTRKVGMGGAIGGAAQRMLSEGREKGKFSMEFMMRGAPR